MDPISAVVFGIIEDFAVSFAASLFANHATRPDEDPRIQRDRGRAKDTVADLLTDSLLPLFPPDTCEEDARLVMTKLASTLEANPLTVDILAEHEHRTPRIVEAVLGAEEDSPDLRVVQLERLHRNALSTIVERYVQIAPDLPQWQRLQWDRSFDLLARIDGNVIEVRDMMREVHNKPGQEAEAFEAAYRRSVAGDNSHITLLGVAAPVSVVVDADTAFVDLALGRLRHSEMAPEDGEEVDIASLEQARKRLERMAEAFSESAGDSLGDSLGESLAQHQRLVIVGAPGSGKTTLMRRLAYCAATGKLTKLHPGLTEPLLPFLFPVRSLDLENLPCPEEFVAHLAPNLVGGYVDGFVTGALNEGRALILIDGLDECEPAQHETLMDWVAGLTRDFGDSRFVVTSRPAGYKAGELRSGAQPYQEAELQALSPEQRETFVQRWYRAAKAPTEGRESGGDPEASAQDLLDRIDKTPSIRFMATNPLLLSVTCVVHRYRAERLPERRAQLLKECVEVLLHEWHRAKKGLSEALLGDLDAAQKTALVRPLAWKMMEEGVAEAPRAEVEEVFREVLPGLREEADRAKELVDHIRDQSGLLVEQRPGIFAFAHLVFQEYLAADHAATAGKLDALQRRADDEQWQEVIPLYAGLPGASPEALIRALVQKEELVLAGRCVASAVQLEERLREEVVEGLVGRVAWYLSDEADALVEIGGALVVRKCFDYILAQEVNAEALMSAPIESTDVDELDARAMRAVAEMGESGCVSASGSACRSAAGSACVSAAWSAADSAAYSAARSAARSAALGLALRAADRAALTAAGSAARSAAGSACVSAAWSAADRAADRAALTAALMERLDVSEALGELKEAVSQAQSTPEQKLHLWCPLAEGLPAEEFEFAMERLGELPGEVFPLLRRCVLRRLEHRWGQDLGEGQKGRLKELVEVAEGDLKAHFERFAEMLGEKKRVEGARAGPDTSVAHDATS